MTDEAVKRLVREADVAGPLASAAIALAVVHSYVLFR
jgi:hypothetical protein